jgi:hypothetical protein
VAGSPKSRPRVTYPKDPAADARLTRAFHRMLRRLTPPPKPVDGVVPVIIGWVQLDTRFLDRRHRQ